MGSAMTFALACAPGSGSSRPSAGGGSDLVRATVPDDPARPDHLLPRDQDEVVPFRGGQPEGEDIRLPAVPVAMQGGPTTMAAPRTLRTRWAMM